MSDHDRNNTVRDPRHPDYSKQTKPTNQELAIRAQLSNILPDPAALSRNDEFLAGKTANFSGLNMAFDGSPAMFGTDGSAKTAPQTFEHRRIGDGFGFFNTDSPKTTNIARISRSGGHTTLAASYAAKQEQVNGAIALEIGLLNSANEQDIIHKTVTIESRGAIRDHTRRSRSEPYYHAVQKKLKNKGRDSTEENRAAWAPLHDRCVNCGQFDHRVVDCWGPTDDYGFIDKCPCNGRNHRSDQCHIVRNWSNLMKYKVFFIYRVGLPQFKNQQSFMHMIIHDPIVRQLHSMIKLAMEIGCTDRSLSWRINPLTKEFCMKTWNHAKPWAYHNHSKTQDRWYNLPDPAYNNENWLEQANEQMPLNPLKQSFINGRMANDLPGMQASWKALDVAKRTGETRDLLTLQNHMRSWLGFYNTMQADDATRLECLFKKLASCTEPELDEVRQWSIDRCGTECEILFGRIRAAELTVKHGIGVPQVPQKESDLLTSVYFLPPGAAAPTTAATSSGQNNVPRDDTKVPGPTGDAMVIKEEEEDLTLAEGQHEDTQQGIDGFRVKCE